MANLKSRYGKTDDKSRKVFSAFFVVWLLVAAGLVLGFFFPEALGIPEVTIKPVYHGALFLGASIIGAVVVWYAVQGLMRAQESTVEMERRFHETNRLAKELDAGFERFEDEFGPIPEDKPGHHDAQSPRSVAGSG